MLVYWPPRSIAALRCNMLCLTHRRLHWLRGAVASSPRRLCISLRRRSSLSVSPAHATLQSAHRCVGCALASPSCIAARKPEQSNDSANTLASLLDPAETVPLVDVMGTYAHMDVVPPCDVYDPRVPNARRRDAEHRAPQREKHIPDEQMRMEMSEQWGPLRRAHARGELWRAVSDIGLLRNGSSISSDNDDADSNTNARAAHCGETDKDNNIHEKDHADRVRSTTTGRNVRCNSKDGPPEWFEQLCRDLYFRTNSEDEWDGVARESDPHSDAVVAAAVQQRRWRSVPDDITPHAVDDAHRTRTKVEDWDSHNGSKGDATRHREDNNNNNNNSSSSSSTMRSTVGEDKASSRGTTDLVDPYLWLAFDLLDVADYTIEPHTFSRTTPFSAMERYRLGLGDSTAEGDEGTDNRANDAQSSLRGSSALGLSSSAQAQPQPPPQHRREYIHFCNAYRFPQRWQLPTSVGTEPVRLWWDPYCPVPVVYVQLSVDFPPAAWLPVRASAAALRRVLGSFARMAALHRDWHHDSFVERYEAVCRVMALQNMSRPAAAIDGPTTTAAATASTAAASSTPSSSASSAESTFMLAMHKDAQGEQCMSHNAAALRMMAYEARNTPYIAAPLREFAHTQDFFLGEYDDPERLLEHMDLCPFLFAIPHLRTTVDVHAEHMTPTVIGPGVALSLYRCRYSKALLQVTVLLSAEVKLPPQDPEAFHFLWKDSQVQPRLRIPVFARLLWPECPHLHMSGGPGRANIVHRLNRLLRMNSSTSSHSCSSLSDSLSSWECPPSNSSSVPSSTTVSSVPQSDLYDPAALACDVPIDAAMALLYAMTWAKQRHQLLGLAGMRQRVAALEAATCLPSHPLLYPGTRECPNPEYTAAEQLGMHIQYLAMLHDPALGATMQALLPSAPAPVRLGCAKAALIAGEREQFRRLVASEPEGRVRHYMTRLVRKRKTRDLTDATPRLLEEQYEFPAPLWTKRGTRVDRSTLEGVVDGARLTRR